MRLLLFCAAMLVAADAVAQVGPRGGLIRSAAARRTTDAGAASTPHPSVCRVVVPEADGVSYGSGTLVDVRGEYGLVVTNWHVVENASGPVTVLFPDGFQSAARIVRTDEIWDLAALAIWRPNCEAVTISTTPPRQGDPLWIAGYGQGNYRIVGGRCTQYVAPGDKQPYEMVELSATARQGDSGGPIFNERGELAGVLFGEGGGATAGSYCGRVAAFVNSVMPSDGEAQHQDVDPADAPETNPDDECGWVAADIGDSATDDNAGLTAQLATTRDGRLFNGRAVAPYHRGGDAPQGYTDAAPPKEDVTQESETGDLPVMQRIRDLLAVVGAGFLVVQAMRMMSPKSSKPQKTVDAATEK